MLFEMTSPEMADVEWLWRVAFSWYNQSKQCCKARGDDRVDGKAPVVVVLGHVCVVLQRRREEEQVFRFHRVSVGLEAGEDQPEDREEEDQRDDPCQCRPKNFADAG